MPELGGTVPLKHLKAFIFYEETLVKPLKCLFRFLTYFIFKFEPLFASFCQKKLEFPQFWSVFLVRYRPFRAQYAIRDDVATNSDVTCMAVSDEIRFIKVSSLVYHRSLEVQ